MYKKTLDFTYLEVDILIRVLSKYESELVELIRLAFAKELESKSYTEEEYSQSKQLTKHFQSTLEEVIQIKERLKDENW